LQREIESSETALFFKFLRARERIFIGPCWNSENKCFEEDRSRAFVFPIPKTYDFASFSLTLGLLNPQQLKKAQFRPIWVAVHQSYPESSVADPDPDPHGFKLFIYKDPVRDS